MDRVTALLSHINIDREVGLEIGPLDRPLVERVHKRSIYYCDYAPTAELRIKSSADPNVNVENIPMIDFVAPSINADSFHGKKFDYIIASHVIEHVPDVVGWLTHLLGSLKPGGRIVLAIPDRRYTFDYIREISTVGDMVQAFTEKRPRPSMAVVYDAFSKAVKVETPKCWEPCGPPVPLERYYDNPMALRLAMDSQENGAYHDCHCWVFEYESFLASMAELRGIGILDVEVLHHTAPVYGANEFHVVLGNV